MLRVALLLVLVALTTSVFADSDIFYVSAANGNDTADCTNAGTPCLTLNGTLAQITSDDDITIYFNGGNYAGVLNVGLTLPVQQFTLEINSNQNTSVVFDCQNAGGVNGINLLYQAEVDGISFINCENGVHLNADWTDSDDEDMLTLNNVALTGCTTGVTVSSGSLTASNITVDTCPTGVSILVAQSTTIQDSTFTGSVQASVRVSTVNTTEFSLNNCTFTNTAGFSLDAVCANGSDTCEILDCTFVNIFPVDNNADGALFELVDGFWTFDQVNVTASRNCTTAFRTTGTANSTWLVLADSTLDNSCATAIEHSADGPLQVLNSQIATTTTGLLITAVDTLKVDSTNFTNCVTNAINAVVTTDQIDISNLFLDNTGPISITVAGECSGGLIESTFVGSRAIINGGEWLLNELTFNNTAAGVQNGGFLQLSSNVNGNTSAGFEIENCDFENAVVSGTGGAIYVQGNTNVSIHDNTFTSNTARDGGAIFVSGLNGLSMKDNEFTLNTATANGGAIYLLTNATLEVHVEDLTFTNNTAVSGAVIFCCNGTCTGNITILQDSDDTLTYENNGNVNTDGSTNLITCVLDEAPYSTEFSASNNYQVSSLDSSSGYGWFFWLIVILLILLIVGIIVAAIVGCYFYRKRMSYSRVD